MQSGPRPESGGACSDFCVNLSSTYLVYSNAIARGYQDTMYKGLGHWITTGFIQENDF